LLNNDLNVFHIINNGIFVQCFICEFGQTFYVFHQILLQFLNIINRKSVKDNRF